MKKILIISLMMVSSASLLAQNYPEPEFANELYLLNKDSIYSTLRLEKNSARMESKTKAGGFGGSESAYTIDGDRSFVRIRNGAHLSFVYSTGASSPGVNVNSQGNNVQDSAMLANGLNPSMVPSMNGMFDPSSMITLYKVESGKGSRKIIYMKTPGAFSFGSRKSSSSEKFSFSVKKIREGYWVLVLDRTLPKGEYAFVSMGTPGINSTAMEMTVFAFGID